MDRLKTVVTIHPTLPAGAEAMTMENYHLTAMVGFTFDTSLAVVRMIYDGFFDRYPDIKFVITHSGGTVPYVTNRLDNGYRILPKCSENISQPPSAFLNRLYYDDAMARDDAAALCMGVCGTEHYIHGSDYPFIPYARSLEWATELDPAVRDAVMGDNAKALYGI
jgi:aminocarboxymuconate-semialdehyde decarboxylase